MIRAWIAIVRDQPAVVRVLLLVLTLGTTALYILGLASEVLAARVAAVPTEEARVVTVRQTVIVMATEIAASLQTTTVTAIATSTPEPTVTFAPARLTRVGVTPGVGVATATLEPTPQQFVPPARIITPTEPPRPASETVTFGSGTPRASGTPAISLNGTPLASMTPGTPAPAKPGGLATLTPTIQLAPPAPLGTPLPGGVPTLTPPQSTITPGGPAPSALATATPRTVTPTPAIGTPTPRPSAIPTITPTQPIPTKPIATISPTRPPSIRSDRRREPAAQATTATTRGDA